MRFYAIRDLFFYCSSINTTGDRENYVKVLQFTFNVIKALCLSVGQVVVLDRSGFVFLSGGQK